MGRAPGRWHSHSLLDRARPRRGSSPAQSLPSDTHAAAGPRANLPARRAGCMKEAEQGLGTPSVAVLSLLALRLGFYTITLSLSLVILFSVGCLSHLSSVPKSWHDTSGHSLPFFPISPTNWLPVPMFTSQAISFRWRLAATHHLRGARNIMIIGAVSLPNKMALMELLFDLVCFVFFQRGTIKNQLRHFN